MPRYYNAFSQVLETFEDFDQILNRGAPPANLVYRLNPEQVTKSWFKGALLYSGVLQSDESRRLNIWKTGSGFAVRFEGPGDYLVEPDSIICAPYAGVTSDELARTLLSSIFSFWLEHRGYPALHASAIVISGRAVVFLAPSRGGKSIVAANWLHAGADLLTDDILAVAEENGCFFGLPSLPRILLAPTAANRLLAEETTKRSPLNRAGKLAVSLRDGPLGFCRAPAPLATVYVLNRDDSAVGITIRRLAAREGAVELLRNSYAGEVASALPESKRFEFLCRMAEKLPIRVLTYPSGIRRLGELREVVLDDVVLNRKAVENA